MTGRDSFFLPSPTADAGYQNVRDLPHLEEGKLFVESLWPKYQHLADPHFREDARNHFLQRFWEMYLACTLLERGLELHRAGGEGPEFYFLLEGKRTWVEATAPGPGTGPDKVPSQSHGEASGTNRQDSAPIYSSLAREAPATPGRREKGNRSSGRICNSRNQLAGYPPRTKRS